MAESADVRSTEAVARFRASLATYVDEVDGALLELDQQINRALHWFDHEAPMMWREEIRRAFDAVARTRTAWENCMLREVAGDRPSCFEEEKAHRVAKRRRDAAVEMPKVVKTWAVKVHREVDEFRGRTAKLRRLIEGDVPRTLGLLDRTIRTLDAYAGQGSRDEGPGPGG